MIEASGPISDSMSGMGRLGNYILYLAAEDSLNGYRQAGTGWDRGYVRND
jgi:hypothetical protein